MATDIRQLLRAERASRRITHPHASYTSDGKLLCNLCETFVKSEAQWQSHLHSTQHNLRSQKGKKGHDGSELESRGKGTKRKAEESLGADGIGEEIEGRKRVRGSAGDRVHGEEWGGEMGDRTVDVREDGEGRGDLASAQEPEETAAREPATTSTTTTTTTTTPPPPPPPPPPTENVYESELLALERDLLALENQSQPNPRISALNAEATISAAPLTAEEVAAQASEEQSTQRRGRRDAEVEEEREDAERGLEEEMEEMRGLEERVRRLKERREELRRGSGGAEEDVGVGSRGEVGDGWPAVDGEVVVEDGEEEEDDEEDSDDDDDGWGFGGGS